MLDVSPFRIAYFFLDGAAVTLVAGMMFWAVDMHTRQRVDVTAIGGFAGMMFIAVSFIITFQRWFFRRVEFTAF